MICKPEEGLGLLWIDPGKVMRQYHTALQTPYPRAKERERFYLLPGMGGRAYRRKRKLILQWSLAAGLLVSAVVAGLLYWMSWE